MFIEVLKWSFASLLHGILLRDRVQFAYYILRRTASFFIKFCIAQEHIFTGFSTQTLLYALCLTGTPANLLLVRRSVPSLRQRQPQSVGLRLALCPDPHRRPVDHCADIPGGTWRAYALTRGRVANFLLEERLRLQDPWSGLLERVKVVRSESIRGRVPVRRCAGDAAFPHQLRGRQNAAQSIQISPFHPRYADHTSRRSPGHLLRNNQR